MNGPGPGTIPGTVTRRQLLTGTPPGPRPPWSLSAALFPERCTRCEDCLRACPEGILVRGQGGYPEVDFRRGGCSFCGACLEACHGRALVGEAGQSAGAWSLRAGIGPACLALAGVVCRSCGEACEARAIRFPPRPGGISRPEPDLSRCSGCGACVAGCPVQAVTVTEAEAMPPVRAGGGRNANEYL
jgi:ferredoxin-type protein NapF